MIRNVALSSNELSRGFSIVGTVESIPHSGDSFECCSENPLAILIWQITPEGLRIRLECRECGAFHGYVQPSPIMQDMAHARAVVYLKLARSFSACK